MHIEAADMIRFDITTVYRNDISNLIISAAYTYLLT